ncbi:MAG: CheR family methyltransferase [Planctomycetota bacterium]
MGCRLRHGPGDLYYCHDLCRESDYCLIVCKNVMLHFQYPERVEVFKMFHQALAPGGYLANENTQKLPQEVSHLFTQVVPDAQLYKKIGD